MPNKLNTSPTPPNLLENTPNVSPTKKNLLDEAEKAQEEISKIGKERLKPRVNVPYVQIENWYFDEQWLSTVEEGFFQHLTAYLALNPNTTHLAQTVFKKGIVESKIIGCHQLLIDLLNIRVQRILKGTIWTVIFGAINNLIQDAEIRQLFGLLQQKRQNKLDQDPKAQLPKFRLPLDTTKTKLKYLKQNGKKYTGKCIATIETVSLPFDDSIRAVMVNFDFEVSDADYEAATEQLHQNLKAGVEKEQNLELKPQHIERIDEKENTSNIANAFPPPSIQQNLPIFPTAPAMSPHNKEPQLPPEPENKEGKKLNALETAKQLVYNSLSSQDLFQLAQRKQQEEIEIAERKRQEELKQERERNRKLVKAILARNQEEANYLAISAKKLPLEFREDFKPLLVGFDDETVNKIIRKGNFSIVIELVNCGNKRCLQGCNSNPPLLSHSKKLLRIYNGRDSYQKLPEEFDLYKYINIAGI